MTEQPLNGGRVTAGVVRVGDTVRRPITGDRRFQHACMRHLEAVGFAAVPRFLGTDDAGREILSFIAGPVPDDLGHYDDDQLRAAAGLLRRFHDATAGIDEVRRSGCEVACHNDWAPTNAVFAAGMPIALIDFDTLRPGTRLWDLGYSAFTWLDLGNDDYTGIEQVRRLKVFAGGYDHSACPATQIAVYALARQTALAASTAARGLPEIARWASAAASWTALNIVEQLLPAGYAAP